jgi:hypothetical protein
MIDMLFVLGLKLKKRSPPTVCQSGEPQGRKAI